MLVLENSVLCTSSSSCFNRMLTLLNWSNGIDAACSSCTARSQRPCGTRSMPWSLNDYPKEDADDSVVEQVWTELAHKLSGVCDVVWTQPLVVGADCSSDAFRVSETGSATNESRKIASSQIPLTGSVVLSCWQPGLPGPRRSMARIPSARTATHSEKRAATVVGQWLGHQPGGRGLKYCPGQYGSGEEKQRSASASGPVKLERTHSTFAHWMSQRRCRCNGGLC